MPDGSHCRCIAPAVHATACSHLIQHPQVMAPIVKEPEFFTNLCKDSAAACDPHEQELYINTVSGMASKSASCCSLCPGFGRQVKAARLHCQHCVVRGSAAQCASFGCMCPSAMRCPGFQSMQTGLRIKPALHLQCRRFTATLHFRPGCTWQSSRVAHITLW